MMVDEVGDRWMTGPVVTDDAVDEGGNVGVNGVNNADGRNDDGGKLLMITMVMMMVIEDGDDDNGWW